MKAKALKGFGMKTSVTSPNLEKYSLRWSAVMSSVHLPTKTLQGTCCTAPSLLLGIFTSHHRPSEMENIANEGEMLAEFCGTYHVSLSQDSHLRFIVGESDESEPFGLTRLYILLDLGH